MKGEEIQKKAVQKRKRRGQEGQKKEDGEEREVQEREGKRQGKVSQGSTMGEKWGYTIKGDGGEGRNRRQRETKSEEKDGGTEKRGQRRTLETEEAGEK